MIAFNAAFNRKLLGQMTFANTLMKIAGEAGEESISCTNT